MLPSQARLIRSGNSVPNAVNLAITKGSCCKGGSVNFGIRPSQITRNALVSILETVQRRLDGAEVLSVALGFGGVDQLLALQHAAEQ